MKVNTKKEIPNSKVNSQFVSLKLMTLKGIWKYLSFFSFIIFSFAFLLYSNTINDDADIAIAINIR
jgi:hypothetical protein